MAKKFEIQNNYILFFQDANDATPTAVMASKNVFFNIDPNGFVIKEHPDNGTITITNVELNGGNVVDNSLTPFTTSTFFDFLTENTGNFNTPTGGSVGGVFGISDSSGVYTYYSDLQSAINAVADDGTIEMFADYSSGNSYTISGKGLRLNMNGHAIFSTSIAPTLNLSPGIGEVVEFKNGTLAKPIGYGGELISATNGILIGESCTLINFSFNCITGNGSGAIENLRISGFNCFGFNAGQTISGNNCIIMDCSAQNGNNDAIRLQGGAIARGCYAKSNSGNAFRVITSGTIENCHGETNSGFGMRLFGATVNNSTARSVNNYGIWCEQGCVVSNCYGWTNTSVGIFCQGIVAAPSIISNCTGYGVTGFGILVYANGSAFNCTGIGQGTFYGMQISIAASGNIEVANCTAITYSGSGALINHAGGGFNLDIKNCSFISYYNNALGAGVEILNALNPTATPRFANNVLKVTNSGAPMFRKIGGGTSRLAFVNNAFQGSTILSTGSFIQVATSTPDAQSNIFNN